MEQVKRAENQDIPGIMALLLQVDMVHHAIRPDLFKGPASKYSAEDLALLLSDDTRPVFVCRDEEGRVLGHCFCVFKQHRDHALLTDVKTLYIDDLCVDENCRGKKIGTMLYDHAVAFARDSGCYNVTLNVWAGNEPALAFYRRQGLKPQKYTLETIL